MKKLRYVVSLSLLLLIACTSNSQEAEQQTREEEPQSHDFRAQRIKELTEKLERDPDMNSYLERARLYETQGMLEAAIRDVIKAVDIDTANTSNIFYLAELYQKRPYYKGAVTAYEQIIQTDPENIKAHLKLGEMYFHVKDREKSFNHLNTALRLDPALPEAFFFRGYNYRELGNEEKAINNYMRAIELKPDYYEAYLQLGLLYADKKDPLAESYYTNALRIRPNDTRALYARGMYYQSIDSTRKALQDYHSILGKEPDNTMANYNIAFNHYAKARYDSAVHYFDKVIRIDPKYAEAYYGKGVSLQALGQNAEAQAALMRYENLKATRTEQ